VPIYNTIGGFAGKMGKSDGPDFNGPAWFTEGIKGVYE